MTEQSQVARRRRSRSRGPGVAVVLVGTAALLVGCATQFQQTAPVDGADEAASGSTSQTAASEPATVRDLSAAVLTHLDAHGAHYTGGNRNQEEGWTAVDFDVDTGDLTVPVSVMALEPTRSADPEELVTCPEDEAVLSCRVLTAQDGYPMMVWTSTEDVVGGISDDGFFVFVVHARDDHLVLVTEALPTRDVEHLRLTGLPVPLEVLEAIATDPLVAP